MQSDPLAVPDAPSAPEFRVVDDATLELVWGSVRPNGSPILRYVVEMQKRSGEDSPFESVYSGSATSCTVAQLPRGASYLFRVRAENGMGSSKVSPVSMFVTAPGNSAICTLISSGCPGAVPPLDFVTVDSASVRLAWASPQPNGSPITEFEVEMGHSTSPFRVVYSGSECFAIVSNLNAGGTYRFRVRARNAVGKGPWSCDLVYYAAEGEL
jgi:hypothetical protein